MTLKILLVVLCWGLAQAQPGTLLEVTYAGVLTAAQINQATAGRFSNNGVQAPAAQNDVDSYIVVFESTDLDENATPVTAQIFVPRGPADERSTFVFGAGSTGLVEACAPSRNYIENRTWDTYTAYTLAYAGQGFVSVVPNYMGFFVVGELQPYFSLEAEGRVMLDGARAVRSLSESSLEGEAFVPSDATFVAGFSQGGHAAFAAADLAASYAPELELSGILGFGATTDLENLFREFTYAAPWIVYAYDTFFPGRIDPADILLPAYANDLANDAERMCVGGAQNYYPSNPASLYTPEFASALTDGSLADTFPDLFELFAENDAGVSAHALPSLLLQGVDDPVVTLDSQNAFVAELCEAGSPVRYPNYLRTRHETRYIGFNEAITWMNALAAGEAPPDDCGNLP